MRPIKLTMTAFGPYSHIEVVDFNELGERNLFLITGPTGAGKTTIFDAISFAMYGETNGNMRSAESLRSQFAEDDLLTEVELLFELKGIKYHIRRMPRQNKPKSKGEGFTEQKADAVLTIYDGEPYSTVSGIKNVNEKIEAVVGINAEQFRQIMMIPQGEFRKMLTADSQEREKVLSQLFDTKLYKLFQIHIDDQAKAIFSQIKNQSSIRNHELSRIACKEGTDLFTAVHSENKNEVEIILLVDATIKEEKEEASIIDKQINMLNSEIEKTIKEKEMANERNDRLKEKERLEVIINEKELMKTEIEALKIAVESAERAFVIEPLEENYNSRALEIEKKTNAIKCMVDDMVKAETEVTQAEAVYQQETTEEKQSARNKKQSELTNLKSYLTKVGRIEDLKQSILINSSKLENLEALKQNGQQTVAQLKVEIVNLRKNKDESHDAAKKSFEMREIALKENEMNQTITQLKEQLVLNSRTKLELKSQQEKLALLEHEINKTEIQSTSDKAIIKRNQAAYLAQHLEEGMACPVCGATHHEKRAEFIESTVNEDDLDVLDQKIKKLNIEFHAENNKASVLNDNIEKQNSMIVKLEEKLPSTFQSELLESWIIQSEKRLNELNTEVEKLEAQGKKINSINEAIQSVEKKQTSVEIEMERITTELNELNSKQIQLKTELENIFSDVPAHLRTMENLNRAISIANRDIVILTEALEASRQRKENAYRSLLTLQTSHDQLKKIVEDEKHKCMLVKSNLELKLTELGFEDMTMYQHVKMTRENFLSAKQRITNFEKEMHGLKLQFGDLQKKTKDYLFVELNPFDEKLKLLRVEISEYVEKIRIIKGHIDNNLKIVETVTGINVEIGEQESKYKIIGHLSRTAQGYNKGMISFERYVLAAFLEDIIKAANIRLRQMTQNRYELGRTEELERKNKQSGLELEVLDQYTGKSRHVKTLSGGESFKASLSMALGLSDVVQSYAGGVQLDTMFIDEGFGTLDQESLDSAINCLIDLQKSGRLVGIISHVQELKERIDTRLEVVSTHTGSTTQFVVM